MVDEQRQPRSPQTTLSPNAVGCLAFLVAVIGLAAVPFTISRIQEDQLASLLDLSTELDGNRELRPEAEVRQYAARCELNIAAIQTEVTVTRRDERWYGDCTTTVTAAVRYHYGVDLQDLDDDDIRYNFLLRRYEISIPAPHRTAVEVESTDLLERRIECSGLRFKRWAGEKYLREAQEGLRCEAQRQTVSRADRAKVRREAAHQLEQLLAKFLDEPVKVELRESS